MWAAGRVRTSGSLLCGLPATKLTSVRSLTEKEGRSGHLTFLTIGHQILQDGELVIDEEQDIVYRQPGTPATASAASAKTIPVGEDEWEIELSPTLLFRFSALTYNAHRIHYDRDYAREVEGFPGLLTHGPLQALAMAEAARAAGWLGDAVFEYRLISPLLDHQGMFVRAVRGQRTSAMSVRDRHGRQTATGTLRARPVDHRHLCRPRTFLFVPSARYSDDFPALRVLMRAYESRYDIAPACQGLLAVARPRRWQQPAWSEGPVRSLWRS